MLVPTPEFVLALAIALTAMAVAIFVSRYGGCLMRHHGSKESFEGGGGEKKDVVVQSLQGARFKIDVVDASGHEMGRCLLLDGRRQFCEADEHRYHEMLVHFPAAFVVGESTPEDPRPRRALIVNGGDCMALREVIKYASSLERVVVLEEDERIVEICERHLGARSLRGGVDRKVVWMIAPPAESISRLVAADNDNLQTFDLVLVDAKDRPGAAGQIGAETARGIKLLLSPEGVVASSAPCPALDATFPYKLQFSFFSATHDAQTRMTVYARFDLAKAEVDGAVQAARVGSRFYDPSAVWSYVPWFLRGGGGGKAAPVGK